MIIVVVVRRVLVVVLRNVLLRVVATVAAFSHFGCLDIHFFARSGT